MYATKPFTWALYATYTRWLLSQVRRGTLPRHIALILDGNRRFAQSRRFETLAIGHELGAEKLDELLDWCDVLEIPVVTVRALSMDNLHRDPEELGRLIEIIRQKISSLPRDQMLRRFPRSIHAVGRLEMLPGAVRQSIERAEAETEHLGPPRFNIAIGYDGRDEITQAVRRLLLERADRGASLEEVAQELSTDDDARWLYRKGDPDPDLIIRTSGELRLSGFLLWQSAYSELYFCDTSGPRFGRWTSFGDCAATSRGTAVSGSKW